MYAYIVFMGERYYPSGGARDMAGGFDSVELAEKYIRNEAKENYTYPWAQIVKHKTMEIVKEFDHDEDTDQIEEVTD